MDKDKKPRLARIMQPQSRYDYLLSMNPSNQFAIVPELDDLAQVERTIAFYPSRCLMPKVLSVEQIKEFNSKGYLSGFQVFSGPEIRDIRAGFDRLLENALAAGGDSYSISSAHLFYGQAYDLLNHDRIVQYVCDLLGENVIGWGCHFFCKVPQDGKQVAWHQDASYWPLTPSKTVTVWLAIDDADSENACMRFIPGSHMQGMLDFEVDSSDTTNVLNQTVSGTEQFTDPVDNILRAGALSLHTDLLLHGSEANESQRRRCGLTLRYCAADVRAYLDWNLKGVVVHGKEREGHWANPPRPEG